MNRMFLNAGVAATIVLLSFYGHLAADTIPTYNPALPVFEYNFPASSGNLSAGPVVDLSSAGHNATTQAFTTTGLSSNVPSSAAPGNHSMDCGSGTTDKMGLLTNERLLLNTQAVADNGGFVMEAWVYPTLASQTGFIISYAGTEGIKIVSGKAYVNVSNSSQYNYSITDSAALSLNEWHHIVGVFDTLGNDAVVGQQANHTESLIVEGTLALYVDGELVDERTNSMKDSQGDSLDLDGTIGRPISIGVHANNPSSSSVFSGLIYNPKVSFLGQVPEPSTFALLGMGLFGLLAYAWRKRR